MNTIKFRSGKTKIIAHRGLSGIEAENTNAAFVAAANRSYWGIETDIHKTKDGMFVIFHDDTTARVTNKNIVVEKSSYSKLSKLNLKDKYGNTRSDYKIPRLEEYVAICKKYEKEAVLELKNRFESEDIKKVIDLINKENYLNKTIFISFQFENLVDVKKILPDARAQLLTSIYSEEILKKIKKHGFGIDIHYRALNEKNIIELKENKIEINCWTCDDKEAAERLVILGVDYITTNILE